MALQKEIVQRNGVVTNYHRIHFVQSIINSDIFIAVLSYLNEESRRSDSSEKFVVSVSYDIPYQENMTVEQAYEYLKTLPEFEGAEDV